MKNLLGRYLHQSYHLVVFCAGVIVGTILALIFRINFFWSPVWVGSVVLVLVLIYLRPRLMFVGLALIAGMVLAFFRVANELGKEEMLRKFVGQEIVCFGEVNGDPETDESGTKVKLVDLKLGENGEHEVGGSIFITLRQNEKIARADTLKLKGRLTEGFGTYAGYMYKPMVLGIWRPEPGDLVLKIRNWFAERIRGLIQSPQVDLGLSYLLGMKSGLPDGLSENLRVVGLVHIVVASGAHLSILVEIARKIFGKLSRFAGLLFSLLFVVFFMAMVGWTPSILRAGVMAILTLAAWYVGRKIAPWRIILLVAAFTLLLDPMFVINLGWLLSFASFGGIMILGPRLTKFFYGEKKPGFVAEVIITTLSATLMTLPIILYFYGAVSLISVLANLLILPTLPYAMGLAFLTGVVAGVPGVEMVVSFLATKLLDFHIAVVEFFGEQKSFLFEMEAGQPQVFLIYALILSPLTYGFLKDTFMIEYKTLVLSIKKGKE
ncbi:ComEC/Rec2 family competence protein [Candidatus Saccharibacteria bacterium]|nr:ComEC/Rec2 family competence protein [Candidatus Saccharibacteria bacterium]